MDVSLAIVSLPSLSVIELLDWDVAATLPALSKMAPDAGATVKVSLPLASLS